jgi:predicted O-methyltransferase YrrM
MKTLRTIKTVLRNMLFKEQALPVAPFGTMPRGSREKYLHLYDEARQIPYPEIDAFEERQGFAIDLEWLHTLALHTQIVVKQSKLNYQHGRLLYVTLRRYLADSITREAPVTVLETGTARGFSALCMSKALIDSNACGEIVSFDVLPHNTPMIWNCIDDHDGLKTRQQLLSPWSEELSRVIFIQGWTKYQLKRTGLSRVHFAFLDAQHTAEDVMAEYVYVRDRQLAGDIIVFDDVTPGLFDGVVNAVDQIESEGLYSVERLQVSGERGYAVGVRIA